MRSEEIVARISAVEAQQDGAMHEDAKRAAKYHREMILALLEIAYQLAVTNERNDVV